MISAFDLLTQNGGVLVAVVLVLVVLCGTAMFGRRRARVRARIVLALLCGGDPRIAAIAEPQPAPRLYLPRRRPYGGS